MKTDLQKHIPLYRDLMNGVGDISSPGLQAWCKEATGGDDYYSFLKILASPKVIFHYNTHLSNYIRHYNEQEEMHVKNLLPHEKTPFNIYPTQYNFQSIDANDSPLVIKLQVADKIINSIPNGLTNLQKVCWIWRETMKIGYDFRCFTGVDERGRKENERFKDNKTVCAFMSEIWEMLCAHKEIDIPCKAISAGSIHSLVAVKILGNKWSIVDWTYGRLFRERNLGVRNSTLSNATNESDFLLCSEETYNRLQQFGRVNASNLEGGTVDIHRYAVQQNLDEIYAMQPKQIFRIRKPQEIEME